jgi:1,4-dihydroxy-2-naphthoate octaprenyltransferase
VFIGTSLAGFVSWSLFFCALCFSLLIQIGTNYANDYYDFINGADAKRVGPARAVASGWISPSAMKKAAFFLFGAAFLVSLPLVVASGLWALFFVFSSIAFGIMYTGGPYPLGYMGLGELLVFPYFGPIAVCGAYFVQSHVFDPSVLLFSFSPGLLSCAILIANNLRDLETDALAQKNTLVVRFGKTFGAWEYALSIGGAILLPTLLGFTSPLILVPFAFFLIRKAFTFQSSQEIASLLPQTALLLIAFTALFCTKCLFS